MATGAEGGPLGAGMAVHLPVNFHDLSEWKEKNKENDSTQNQRDKTRAKQIKVVATCRLVVWMVLNDKKKDLQHGRLVESVLVSEAKDLEMLDE